MTVYSPCYLYIINIMNTRMSSDLGFGPRYRCSTHGDRIGKEIDVSFIFDVYTNEIKRK